MKLGSYRRAAIALVGTVAAAAAVGQSAGPGQSNLNIPVNPTVFATDDPSVRKATAIVNGVVLTGTDVDHRVALMMLAFQGQVPPEEMQRLRAQALRTLVDETLQMQAAEAAEIKIEQREVDALYARYASNLQRTPEQLTQHLRENNSSEAAVKRQIRGELAWSRLQGRDIEPFVNVSQEEVRAVLERMNAAKGTQEYRIGEIFLAGTPETATETYANASRIVEQIRNGAPFAAYARQFSEASTAAVGGDLGWVRAEQLPDTLAQAARMLPVGQVSDPIPVPGGYSIVAVADTRQVLTADPRDAVLSLKQLSLNFAAGTAQAEIDRRVSALAALGQTMGGCGRAEESAAKIGAEVVSNDQTRVRDLPPALQDMMLKLNIGQATSPFGSPERVSILVLCGRDDPEVASGPSFDQIQAQLEEQRINLRARRYLRDLRRDAVIDYR